jgi:hypothetical protein
MHRGRVSTAAVPGASGFGSRLREDEKDEKDERDEKARERIEWA